GEQGIRNLEGKDFHDRFEDAVLVVEVVEIEHGLLLLLMKIWNRLQPEQQNGEDEKRSIQKAKGHPGERTDRRVESSRLQADLRVAIGEKRRVETAEVPRERV